MSTRAFYGINEIRGPQLEGMTVSQVLNDYRGHLNVPASGTRILVNDREINNPRQYTIREGDVIEFVKSAGEKGSS